MHAAGLHDEVDAVCHGSSESNKSGMSGNQKTMRHVCVHVIYAAVNASMSLTVISAMLAPDLISILYPNHASSHTRSDDAHPPLS